VQGSHADPSFDIGLIGWAPMSFAIILSIGDDGDIFVISSDELIGFPPSRYR
jgi:hypothetical protein